MLTDNAQQIKLINQALAAAAASIELSRKLLAEFAGIPPKPTATVAKGYPVNNRPAGSFVSNASSPGIVGIFDGENMVTEGGDKFPVPGNYASKTLLVYGDKLKMIDGSGGLNVALKPGGSTGKLFKQIERVKRQRVTGTLSQKDGNWFLTSPEGSYKVLEASVSHFGVKVGDRLIGILPKDHNGVPFAALEGPENQKFGQNDVAVGKSVPAEKSLELKVEVTPAKEKPVKEVAIDTKTEVTLKKPSPKVTKVPEASVKVSAVKVSLTKTAKKEDLPVRVGKEEKIEKKNEPVISDDDLR